MKRSSVILISALVIGGLVVGLTFSTNPVWAADAQADDSVPVEQGTFNGVCTINTTGAIAHWPLNESAGVKTFVDVIGGHDGTCTSGKCPAANAGVLSGAKYFNSDQKDLISVPTDAAFSTMANGNFSVGVWVKTNQNCSADPTPNKVFVGRYRTTPSDGSWWVGCTSGVAVFRLRDSNNQVRQINGVSKINDGLWHYVVGVRNASADKNFLYVDGKLEGTLTAPAYTGDFDSNDPITMGAYDEPVGYYLNGTLDEIVLYDQILSPADISNQHADCSPTIYNYLPIISK